MRAYNLRKRPLATVRVLSHIPIMVLTEEGQVMGGKEMQVNGLVSDEGCVEALSNTRTHARTHTYIHTHTHARTHAHTRSRSANGQERETGDSKVEDKRVSVGLGSPRAKSEVQTGLSSR